MSQPYGHRAEIERLDERSDSTSGSAAHGVGGTIADFGVRGRHVINPHEQFQTMLSGAF